MAFARFCLKQRRKAAIRVLMVGIPVWILYLSLQPFLYPTLSYKDYFSSQARKETLNKGRMRNLSYLPIYEPVSTPRGFQNSRFLVIILVPSSPLNIQKRNAIRKTWGRQENWDAFGQRSAALLKQDYRTTFVLGASASESITREIHKEIAANHDILLGNFTDSYMSLIIKVFMALKWTLSIDCEYILKADDDVYVNVPTLTSWLLKNENSRRSKNLYSGFVHWHVVPIRNTSSKHFLMKDLYPMHAFPPYCGGPSYIFSRHLAARILNVSHVIRPLWIEDAYMGMLAYYLGVSPLHHEEFRLRFNNITSKELHSLNECFFFKMFTYGHELGSNDLFYIHDKVRTMNLHKDQLSFYCLLEGFSMGSVGLRMSLSVAGIVICIGMLKWIRWTLAKKHVFG